SSGWRSRTKRRRRSRRSATRRSTSRSTWLSDKPSRRAIKGRQGHESPCLFVICGGDERHRDRRISLQGSVSARNSADAQLVPARAHGRRRNGLRAPRKSAKTVLQEWAQAEHHPLPLYRTLDISGPEHRRGFVVEVEVEGNVAQGSGQSKRAAEEAAAAKLLELVTHER